MRAITAQWSRRHFMKAAGIGAGAAGLLAWIPTLSTEAQPAAPRRLLLLSHGNGSVLERWRSNGSGSALVDGAALPALRGPILEPLDAHREKLLLLDGIDLAASLRRPDGTFGHFGSRGHAGSSVLFTGRNGGGTSFEGDAGAFPDMPSVDHIVNQRIGEGRKSLQLAVWNRPFDPRSVYSYGEGGAPNAMEPSPQVAFDDVFRDGFGGTDGAPDRTGPRRQRTLSLIRGQIARLRAELPAVDRDRLDRHVSGLDALESRIALAPTAMCTTSAGDRPAIDADFREDTPATLDAQIEVIVHAFACDRVRVASLQLVPENSWSSIEFLPEWRELGGGGAHTVSHDQNAGLTPDVRQRSVDKMTLLNRFCAEKVAHLLGRLEEAGVMADTLVVWAPAMSHAGFHSNINVPVVIAQGTAGPFRANRYLRWGDFQQPPMGDGGTPRTYDAGNESNNNLLVSICHAMGLGDIEAVGEARLCRPEGLDERLG